MAAAETDARSIAAALAVGATDSVVTVELAEKVVEAFQNRPGVSIIFPDGSTRGLPVQDAGSETVQSAREGNSVTSPTPDGAEILVPVLVADATALGEPVVVRTFVPNSRLEEGVVQSWMQLALLGVILVMIAGVATDRLGRRMVRPVAALSDAARALAEGDLDRRIVPAGPEELAEVGHAFNFLASRLEALLREERENVADLSHRLRTPLTALRLQAETLTGGDESAALLADISRMEGAVDRMIREARGTTPDIEVVAPVADLGATVRHRSTFWKVLADEQARPVEVETQGGRLPVPLSPDELGAVIDTLMENVFSHTAPGTGYRIAARPGSDQTAVLVIEDAGLGFGKTSRVERGKSGGGSTGLGLDIVRKAAEKTGGHLAISNRAAGGGRVEVVFGTTDR